MEKNGSSNISLKLKKYKLIINFKMNVKSKIIKCNYSIYLVCCMNLIELERIWSIIESKYSLEYIDFLELKKIYLEKKQKMLQSQLELKANTLNNVNKNSLQSSTSLSISDKVIKPISIDTTIFNQKPIPLSNKFWEFKMAKHKDTNKIIFVHVKTGFIITKSKNKCILEAIAIGTKLIKISFADPKIIKWAKACGFICDDTTANYVI